MSAGSGVRVRAVRRADVPRLREMMRGLAEYERLLDGFTGTAEDMERALFGPGPRLDGLVAEQDGGLVGYALFYPVFGSFRARWRLWLEDLYVEPSRRGTGAGRLLLAEVARAAVEGGFVAVDWEVLDWNLPAVGFYERLGAGRIGTDWLRYRLTGAGLHRLAGAEAPDS